ncbi:hypothetical protein [Skermanella pratensis]|uniref:hypothetical protein n=1 Tax=Skermanella pratensis TaxID=2233999 RepID=UPI0013018509|nr:hypothetical protein [Skermanella pratensis]
MCGQTTETAALRTIRTLTVVLACSFGYAAGAVEQAAIGTPWPTAVRADVAEAPPPRQTYIPAAAALPQAGPPKRIEKLL